MVEALECVCIGGGGGEAAHLLKEILEGLEDHFLGLDIESQLQQRNVGAKEDEEGQGGRVEHQSAQQQFSPVD